MRDPLFDQEIANAAAAVDQCMKLGGVILKPAGAPTFGFGVPKDERLWPEPKR